MEVQLLTTERLAALLHEELAAEGWGMIDPYWIRMVADGAHLEAFGVEHPATRAAAGRLLALRGEIPQREIHWHPPLRALGCANASTPETVAWYRQSKADPGCKNRRWRRYELTLRREPDGLTVAA